MTADLLARLERRLKAEAEKQRPIRELYQGHEFWEPVRAAASGKVEAYFYALQIIREEFAEGVES